MKTKHYKNILTVKCPTCGKQNLKDDIDTDKVADITPCQHLIFAYNQDCDTYRYIKPSVRRTYTNKSLDEEDIIKMEVKKDYKVLRFLSYLGGCGYVTDFFAFKND